MKLISSQISNSRSDGTMIQEIGQFLAEKNVFYQFFTSITQYLKFDVKHSDETVNRNSVKLVILLNFKFSFYVIRHI